ncbi:Leu/Ile/Val-binding protein precursor [mine drainage metagenome]|uniref:Leu/Ile/Val-binding protein n=1 Tax=mine drainage metagenome TaxID=410659 RepID=A0A1J5RR27_9ZZZZ
MNRCWKKLTAGCALALFATFSLFANAATNDYQLNVVLSLTGRFAFLGKAEQHSLELLQKAVNADGGIRGRPLQYKFYDDQSSPQTAVQMATEVLAAHPAVMMGPSIVAMCNAVAPLVQKSGPVQYCMSPGIHPAKGSYVFTSGVSTIDQGNTLIRYFRLKGWKRIAIMTSTDASGQDAERGLESVLKLPENKDIKVVENVHFNITDVSVAAQIERVKAAKPQAFIAWSTGAPVATVFKGIVQAGLNVPVATTDGNMTYAQMKQYAAFLPKDLYFPSGQWISNGTGPEFPPAVKKAQEKLLSTFKAVNESPDEGGMLAWGPGTLLVDALRSIGPEATATQLRDYLAHLKNAPGVNGMYDFVSVPQRGLGVKNIVVTRWNAANKHWDVVSQPTGIPLAH